MNVFDANDVTIEHAKLASGGGYLRLIHRPSGLFVESRYTSTTRVINEGERLMDELRHKVFVAGGSQEGLDSLLMGSG